MLCCSVSGSSVLRSKRNCCDYEYYCIILVNLLRRHQAYFAKRENFSCIRMSWAFVESYYSNGFLMRSYVQVPLWRPEKERMLSVSPLPLLKSYYPHLLHYQSTILRICCFQLNVNVRFPISFNPNFNP